MEPENGHLLSYAMGSMCCEIELRQRFTLKMSLRLYSGRTYLYHASSPGSRVARLPRSTTRYYGPRNNHRVLIWGTVTDKVQLTASSLEYTSGSKPWFSKLT